MTITLRAGDAPVHTATTQAVLDAVTAASFGCRSEELSLLGFAAHVGSAGSLAHLIGVHDGALKFLGKQAMTNHLMHLGELLEFQQERPLEYLASDNRVVVLGQETYVVKKTGVTVTGSEYADVVDFREGLITRFLIIQDLTAVVDAYRDADRKF